MSRETNIAAPVTQLWPTKILMVKPDAFRIEYAINPHMLNDQGALNQVDRGRAVSQWNKLKEVYERLGFEVMVMECIRDFPDMVFSANQTLWFQDKEGQSSVILSHMHAPERRGEVAEFRRWCERLGYQVFELQSKNDFEGAGDALWNYERRILFGGYGFRTGHKVYDEIGQITASRVVKLELIDSRFYHLDTCLSILNGDTAAYIPEAFTSVGRETLAKEFPKLITISLKDGLENFAANSHSPDGKNVVTQQGAQDFVFALKRHGFHVIEVDTSEFMKSGGSVFCLKQMVF